MIYDILPVNNYIGNNSTKTFDFNFYIEDYDQLLVNFFDENDTKYTLQLNVDYTINETKNKNGSYITFPIEGSKYEILQDNQKLSIELTLPIAQEIQYNNSSLLNLETLEYSLDYLTRLIQIIARKQSLCLKKEENSNTSLDEIVNNIYKNAQASQENLSQCQQISSNIENIQENIVKINEDIKSHSEKFNSVDDLQQAMSQKANTTLDNIEDIDENFKESVMSWMTPDYENSIRVASLPFTAPCDGYFYPLSQSDYSNFNINGQDPTGNNSELQVTKGASMAATTLNIVLSKNDTISIKNGIFWAGNFFPMKGGNN